MVDRVEDNQHIRTTAEADDRLDDFMAELSGTKSGYNYRTSAAGGENNPATRGENDRKKTAQTLSELAQLLNDPAYAEAYNTARSTIADFRDRMAARMEQLEDEIEVLDERLESLALGSSEHTRLMRERETLQRRQQELLDYHANTIQPFEDRMNDPDNPPSKEELDGFNERVRQDMEKDLELSQGEQQSAEPELTKQAEVQLPNLGA